MRWISITLLSLILGLNAHANASPQDELEVEQIVQAVEDTYRDVETLRADFVQITRSVALGEEQKQKGHVIFQRPKKMRWDFKSPDERVFVTDGTQMWIYTPAENQAMVYQDLGGSDGMSSLLTDLSQIDEFFDVERLELPRERQSISLKLTPKEETGFKYLKLTVSKKKYEVEQVVIVDTFDNETELSFSQVRLNPNVADAEFEFVPPEGVEVIRPDGL